METISVFKVSSVYLPRKLKSKRSFLLLNQHDYENEMDYRF
jgi:hypothetical protein